MIRQDFNEKWHVDNIKTAFSGLMRQMQAAEPPKEIRLPHDAMILAQRDENASTDRGGGFFKPQDLTYTKNLYVAKEDKGKVFFLEFEGVYMSAAVLVNGEFAGKNDYGYNDFFVRIDDFLRYGQDNTITVNVLNTQQPNSRWYSGTGIYRNVKLLVGEAMHIVPNGLRVTTVDASDEVSALLVESTIANEQVGCVGGAVRTVIRDGGGNILTEDTAAFTARSGEVLTIRQNLYLKSTKLWSPDHPNLHTCEITLMAEGREADKDVTSFGIRKLQLDTIHGLRINGKSYKLKGGCIHHDNGVLGAATFEDAEERRVRLMKQAGYNAIRSAHNPTSKALLDACDKLGMMVMDEYSDVWTWCKSTHDYANHMADHWEKDIESLVARDYNHPSVIMYSVGNEVPEVGKKVTGGMARKMAQKIHSLDGTRYVTNGVQTLLAVMDRMPEIMAAAGAGQKGPQAAEVNEMMSNFAGMKQLINTSSITDDIIEESCAMLDIVGYNYATVRFERDHAKYPHCIFVGSETFAADLAANWAEVEKHPHVLGDFSWTAFDYLGEAGIGTIRYADTASQAFYAGFPQVSAECGDFDITGHRLPVSYWREIVWGGRNHSPYIAVQNPERYGEEAIPTTWSWTNAVSSWTWPGFEGKGAVVEVYSDAEEVELLVNGRSLGKKPVGDAFKPYYCKWDTVYDAGEVKAVAYIDGKEVGSHVLKTAGTPHLHLTTESGSLRAGSNDLCYVNIELVDEYGTLNTSADKAVTLRVDGPVSIQGSGSGNPKTEENYYDTTHKTFYGKALCVLRAGVEKGMATLTISAEGIKSASITVTCV